MLFGVAFWLLLWKASTSWFSVIGHVIHLYLSLGVSNLPLQVSLRAINSPLFCVASSISFVITFLFDCVQGKRKFISDVKIVKIKVSTFSKKLISNFNQKLFAIPTSRSFAADFLQKIFTTQMHPPTEQN